MRRIRGFDFLTSKARAALAIGLVYAVCGAFWIFVTDRLVSDWTQDPSLLLYRQTIQGWVFVGISALLLGGLLYLVLGRRDAALEGQREAERSLSALLSQVPGMVYRRLADEASTLKLVSNGALELTGYASEDLLENRKKAYAEIIHPEDRAVALQEFLDAASKGRPFEASYRIVTADGAIKWVQDRGRAAASRDEEPPILEGIVTDITRQKEADARMSQAARLEALATLSAGIAHDFNNALTGIMGFVELMLRDVPAGSQLERDLIQIGKIAANVQHLTGQLLAFSRRQPTESTVVDLNSVVSELSRILNRLIGSNIDVVLKLGEGGGCVQINRSMLEHVVINLVVNARDAMPDGGRITISSRLVSLHDDREKEEAVAKSRKFIELTVQDTGCGIEPAIAQRIFEPFFTTKAGKGTGLGLSTVYGTVTHAGGRIEVESQPGAGTTFQILLPISERSPGAVEAVRRLDLKSRNLSVLALEDDASVLEFIQRVLEAEGITVFPAHTAEDALRIGRSERVDLLITDSVLPRLLGVDVYAELREQLPDLKVLYISGSFDPVVLRNRMDERAGPRLSKRFSPIELLDAVAVAMG